MKKLVSMVLSLALLFALLPLVLPVAQAAGPDISIKLDKTSIKAGETITVTYSATGLPENTGIDAHLYIDNEWADSKELSSLSGTVSFNPGYGNMGKIDISCSNEKEDFWYSEESDEFTITGSAAPIVPEIELSKTSVNPGDTVTVSWDIKGGVAPMVQYLDLETAHAVGNFRGYDGETHSTDYKPINGRKGSASVKIPGGEIGAFFVLYVVDVSTGYDKAFVSKIISVSGTSFTGWVEGYDDSNDYEWGWAYFENSVPQTGWKQHGGKWYYLQSGNYLTKFGWMQDGGAWYWFDEKAGGAMKTGWFKDEGDWYYANKDGVMQTGWLEDGGSWYYLGGDGKMRTGWVNAGGSWYYLKPDGAMATGWVQSGNSWYYMSSSGAMKTGWVNADGGWYYMGSGGAMRTGWVQEGSSWYYLKPGGSMATGEYTVDGAVSVFNGSGVWVGYK